MSKSNRPYRQLLIERFDGRCVYCNIECRLDAPDASADLATRDHYVPLVRGGTNTQINLVLACWSCNNRKGDMDGDEFKLLLAGYIAAHGQPPARSALQNAHFKAKWVARGKLETHLKTRHVPRLKSVSQDDMPRTGTKLADVMPEVLVRHKEATRLAMEATIAERWAEVLFQKMSHLLEE